MRPRRDDENVRRHPVRSGRGGCLHQRVTADDRARRPIAFEAAHRTEPRFQASMVILRCDCSRTAPCRETRPAAAHRSQHPAAPPDPSPPRPVAMRADRRREEPAGRSRVALRRDVHANDLAVLIDRPLDVAPPACELHIRLIHKPTTADRMSARPGRVNQEWQLGVA